MKDTMRDELGAPKIPDRSTFQAELDALQVGEKAHTGEGDAISAARRRLPMVEVDGATPLIGEPGTVTRLTAFEGRRMLIAYYFMWHTGRPAPEQCAGCTWITSQVRELSYIHSRAVTFAVFCQGPYEEVARLDGLRAAEDVGGLAGRLAAKGHYGHAAYQWTSHLPVVSPEGRVFGRTSEAAGAEPRLAIPRPRAQRPRPGGLQIPDGVGKPTRRIRRRRLARP
jgi:hypothetical protein